MKWILCAALAAGLVGCESTDIDNGDGTLNVTITECTTTSTDPLYASDPPGVVATCDDHLPCTVDVQCTPCSAVPESIRFVKATCVPDEDLSPFCFDSATGALLYTGCTHFIDDPTPLGTINACFPVKFPSDPDSEVHAGVCDAFGVCVENPQSNCLASPNSFHVESCR